MLLCKLMWLIFSHRFDLSPWVNLSLSRVIFRTSPYCHSFAGRRAKRRTHFHKLFFDWLLEFYCIRGPLWFVLKINLQRKGLTLNPEVEMKAPTYGLLVVEWIVSTFPSSKLCVIWSVANIRWQELKCLSVWKLDFELTFLSRGRGTPIWNRQGCSSEMLNLTPKGDHLGVAQAFCGL